jgi:hypothetical protein
MCSTHERSPQTGGDGAWLHTLRGHLQAILGLADAIGRTSGVDDTGAAAAAIRARVAAIAVLLTPAGAEGQQ